MICRSKSNLGHVGSKTRSLGQTTENSVVHSRGQSFDAKFMKFCQTFNPHNFRSYSKLGHVWSKPRSLRQILLKKKCVFCRGHSYGSTVRVTLSEY